MITYQDLNLTVFTSNAHILPISMNLAGSTKESSSTDGVISSAVCSRPGVVLNVISRSKVITNILLEYKMEPKQEHNLILTTLGWSRKVGQFIVCKMESLLNQQI